MNYFSIQHTLDIKIMGHYPQVKEVLYHCDIWNDPRFMGRFHYEKIEINPIVANPILHPKAQLTDLIHIEHVGFTFYKLISGKLKRILEKYRDHGLQMFQCSVFHNGIEYEDYWLMYLYVVNHDFVDLEYSILSVDIRNKEGSKVGRAILNISSPEELDRLAKMHIENNELIEMDKTVLKKNIPFHLLYLNYPGRYVVSEVLKDQIESAGCTGIEFMPVELSLNEWLSGERERVYGRA